MMTGLLIIHNDLPEVFAAALNEYNSATEENFGQFLLIASRMADMKQEYCLPPSEIAGPCRTRKEARKQSIELQVSQRKYRMWKRPLICLHGECYVPAVH
ncbi:putative ATP-dependent RNA helicase DDX60 [Theristicus caerulescens]